MEKNDWTKDFLFPLFLRKKFLFLTNLLDIISWRTSKENLNLRYWCQYNYIRIMHEAKYVPQTSETRKIKFSWRIQKITLSTCRKIIKKWLEKSNITWILYFFYWGILWENKIQNTGLEFSSPTSLEFSSPTIISRRRRLCIKFS